MAKQLQHLVFKLMVSGLILAVILVTKTTAKGDNNNPDNSQKLFKHTSYVMGSLMDISVYAEDGKIVNNAIEKAFNEAERLDRLMSNYKNDSELSRVNRNAISKHITCDNELLYIIEESLRYSRITEGAFDITVFPLVNVWGFFRNFNGNITGNIPALKELQAILPAVSYKNILINSDKTSGEDKSTIFFKNRDTQIDLGAIGKGYAVDMVSKILQSEGITSALVNFAGNICAFGSPPGRNKWAIGIKDPTNINSIIGSFQIKDKSVSTSGDYEKFFVKDGKRYAHIIDPVTGRPVSGVLSVTILANTAMEADALSTGIFVMGQDKGFRLLKNLENVEGIMIFEDEESNIALKKSRGFTKTLELNNIDAKWRIFESD